MAVVDRTAEGKTQIPGQRVSNGQKVVVRRNASTRSRRWHSTSGSKEAAPTQPGRRYASQSESGKWCGKQTAPTSRTTNNAASLSDYLQTTI